MFRILVASHLARTTVTDRGWQAEIAIPLATMGFKEGSTTWGFNLHRLRKQDESSSRWILESGKDLFVLASMEWKKVDPYAPITPPTRN